MKSSKKPFDFSLTADEALDKILFDSRDYPENVTRDPVCCEMFILK